jgi:hypothetical protein
MSEIHILDIGVKDYHQVSWKLELKKGRVRTKTNEIPWRCVINMVVPLAKVLDTFAERILQDMIFLMSGHAFPMLDKEFKTWDNAPDRWRSHT